MDDTKKPAQTGAQRQRKYAAKQRLIRDAARMAFNRRREAALLAKYQAALTMELALNPRSRAATLFARRVKELTARLTCAPIKAGG